jgi:hypothetical protein
MTDLTILTPTRGRPGNARRLRDAVTETAPGALLMLGVDADDADLVAYQALARPGCQIRVLAATERRGMVAALNMMASAIDPVVPFIGFLGDDHVPRTPGWDRLLCDAITAQGGGIAYGNDHVHGPGLATAAVMDARIPRTLGYMAPPTLAHLFVDNVWMDWGRGVGNLAYVPGVVIEHLHPIVGKAEWDAGYVAVNGPLESADRAAYESYRDGGGLAADVAKLRAT